MDTDTLYTLAKDAKLNFNDEDHSDAVAVWVDGLMQSPEYLDDLWLDFLAEIHNSDSREEWHSLARDIGKAHEQGVKLRDRLKYGDISSAGILSVGLTQSLGYVGTTILKHLTRGAEKHVERFAEEWWGDVRGYEYDMQEGAREDWEYERWKDRQLEERE